ncbi:MAG: YceI family protein [Maricaulaceae bacterium]
MKRALLALAWCGLTAATASAQALRSFVLDPDHTQVLFAADRFGFTPVEGRFERVQGVLRLDPQTPETATLEAVIDAGSFSTGHEGRDREMTGPNWLDVAAFPTIRFDAAGAQLDGEDAAIVPGELTLRGLTRPVSLSVRLNGRGAEPGSGQPSLGFTAEATLDRRDFGMTGASGLIGDEITVRIHALAQLGRPPPNLTGVEQLPPPRR